MTEPKPTNGYITWHNLMAAIGGAATIIGISALVIGALYAIYGRDMDQVRLDIAGMQSRELQRIADDAYHRGQIDQKITDARSAIVQLDTTLQREMRLLDDTTRAQINAADSRLQQEIRTIADTITKFITDNSSSIRELTTRQQELMEFRAEMRSRTNTGGTP